MSKSKYVPLALKYRPEKFDDVIGQPVVIRALTNSFLKDTLHNAYIFSGVYGAGKTTVARILAAMLNCKSGKTLEPCGKCENCVEIFAGKSSDVKEINGSDNRGIDDIRALREELGHATISCRKKVIVIDECHGLTQAASESALKMIEEPPPNVMFILATTEAHKITPTIKSRCIMWQFKKIDWRELNQYLIKIAKMESIQYEEDAIKMIAKNSRGSARDAIRNLQVVVEYAGDASITKQIVMESLGIVSEIVFYNLFKYIGEKQVDKVLSCVNEIFKYGNDISYVVWSLHTFLSNVEKYRGLQASLNSQGSDKDVSDLGIFDDDELTQIKIISQNMSGKGIRIMKNLLSEADRGLTGNLNPVALIEGFAVQSCFIGGK